MVKHKFPNTSRGPVLWQVRNRSIVHCCRRALPGMAAWVEWNLDFEASVIHKHIGYSVWRKSSESVQKLWNTQCAWLRGIFLFCFIRGVVRNKIGMLHESEKLACEAFAYFASFSHTGASNTKRAEDFYFQFEKQSQRWQWRCQYRAVSK